MQKMGQLSQQLQEMKQAMQQNQQRQIVNEMRRTTQDLLGAFATAGGAEERVARA